MTTTTCSWNVDWNQCANCARLKKRVDDAHATLLAASGRVDQAYDEYRDVQDAGHAAIGTPSHRAWQARLDNLERQVDEASAASHAAIDEWGRSIRLHHRFHVAYTRIAADGHVTSGETDALPETEEMSAVPAAKIAHSHNLTASTAECPLCSMLDRDRIDARAALAARAQNLHMLTDKYIHQLENGTLGYDKLGKWTDRLLEAGDDWSSHQSAVTNAEWRYRNAITVHSDLAAARRCETEEMEEVPHADPLIRADKLMGILDREQAAYETTIGFCDLWDLDASDLHARLATVQTIRTQLERLIDEAKETTNA